MRHPTVHDGAAQAHEDRVLRAADHPHLDGPGGEAADDAPGAGGLRVQRLGRRGEYTM